MKHNSKRGSQQWGTPLAHPQATNKQTPKEEKSQGFWGVTGV